MPRWHRYTWADAINNSSSGSSSVAERQLRKLNVKSLNRLRQSYKLYEHKAEWIMNGYVEAILRFSYRAFATEQAGVSSCSRNESWPIRNLDICSRKS